MKVKLGMHRAGKVRVHPKQDDKQSYEIFVLDPSSLSVLSRHGFYEVRA